MMTGFHRLRLLWAFLLGLVWTTTGIFGASGGYDGRGCEFLAAKGGSFCFPAGTMVVMADGSSKAIEEIKEGDKVMADDPEDALPPSSKSVTHLHKNWTQRFIHIQIDTDSDGLPDSQLRATGEHPFWVVGKGWVDAQELQTGDALISDGGASPVVISTQSEATTADTFNPTVRDSHTFFVCAGSVPVLVHNTEPWEFNSSVDLDWTGRGGNAYQQMHGALDEAFSRTGVPRSSFEVSKWGLDQHGKSFPTEWRAPGGAEVSIDDPRLVRSANGPQQPHIGYQTGGKRGVGGAVRGHILVDDVPVTRPRIGCP